MSDTTPKPLSEAQLEEIRKRLADEWGYYGDDGFSDIGWLLRNFDAVLATTKALREALIDLIDASQDPRCADLRIVVKRARAALGEAK